MKILFTLCGRAGSKGIRNKNCMSFLDKPLIGYSLSVIDLYLQKNEVDADIALNTDSDDLKVIAQDVSSRDIIIVERKENLAGDSIGKIDVIRDTLLQMENQQNSSYDYVVDLDITSPLRTPEDLKKVICEINSNTNYDVVFTVVDSRRNPYFNMVKRTDDGFYTRVNESKITARQQALETFDMNASIYAYSIDFLKAGKGIFEGNCGIVKMKDTGVLDLDRPDDLELMQIVGSYLFDKDAAFAAVRNNIK